MLKLNHVALTVSDRARSADFYRRWFGLELTLHEDDHLLILGDDSGGLLALSQGTVSNDPPPRTTHFGFEVGSVGEVVECRVAFANGGVREAEWQEAGPTRVQVFDPDGYRVEVFAFGYAEA